MVLITAKSELSVQDMKRREQATARHERLVAYVHALSDTHEVRTGVWMEHSYARARGSLPSESEPRVLLGVRAPSAAEELLDVERLDPPAPSPPRPDSPLTSDPADSDPEPADEGWETRVVALAPTAVHARLAGRALEILRSQRLARLAAGQCSTRQREAARTAARRLRSALAPLWAGQARVPHWLHETLSAHLPRQIRRQYQETIAEVVRAAPRLADRLGPNLVTPARAASPVKSCEASGPLLAWVSDERWERRLAPLVTVRALCLPEGASGPPESWCAVLAGALRAGLAEVLAEAGDRGVVVGGSGAGAALGAWLACGTRVRGLVLVGPALETAEGARDSPEDPLRELRVPMLVVCGRGGGSRARALCARAGRRLLEVRGVDGALRLARRFRWQARLTQDTLDAAVAEECARWVHDLPDGEQEVGRVRRTQPLASTTATLVPAVLPDIQQKIASTKAVVEEEDFGSSAHGFQPHTTTRSIEIAEGRVVTRVSGGTPLALALPWRSSSGQAGGSDETAGVEGTRLAPADIMQMPIVFADDARSRLPPESTTVAAVAAPYSRVIVAKRRAVGGAGVRPRGLLVRRTPRPALR